MVCYNTKRNILFLILVILNACNLGNLFHYILNGINLKKIINTLHIIGGGSLNRQLNQFTANATGVEVLAGPQECTALGNIMIQAKAAGEVNDIFDMRSIIADSVVMNRFVPEDKELWDEAYGKYLEIKKRKG